MVLRVTEGSTHKEEERSITPIIAFSNGYMVHFILSFIFKDRIGGVMFSVLALSAVDRGFIGGVMVSVLALSAVDRGFESQSGQINDYTICICCFSAKHTALRRKSKDWLAWNQNNVSEWSDISTHGLLFQ